MGEQKYFSKLHSIIGIDYHTIENMWRIFSHLVNRDRIVKMLRNSELLQIPMKLSNSLLKRLCDSLDKKEEHHKQKW